MRKRNGYDTCPFARVDLPLGVTLLTESSEQKVRNPAVVLALCETGGEFTSQHRVVPGEEIGFILHPSLRYAIRGRVIWTRSAKDKIHTKFGVAFEKSIPDSLWESFVQAKAA
ncbi:MAG: hypothetical protein P8Z30_05275 [Acidobacteriota bacterium]